MSATATALSECLHCIALVMGLVGQTFRATAGADALAIP